MPSMTAASSHSRRSGTSRPRIRAAASSRYAVDGKNAPRMSRISLSISTRLVFHFPASQRSRNGAISDSNSASGRPKSQYSRNLCASSPMRSGSSASASLSFSTTASVISASRCLSNVGLKNNNRSRAAFICSARADHVLAYAGQSIAGPASSTGVRLRIGGCRLSSTAWRCISPAPARIIRDWALRTSSPTVSPSKPR